MQWVYDSLLALRIVSSSTVKASFTTKGTVLKALGGAGGFAPETYFPFKVYVATGEQIDNAFGEDADPEAANRTLVVRCGRVGDDPITGDGQDGYDTDPDSDFLPTTLPDSSPVTPIVVPDDLDAYYFWIEITTDGPELHSDDDPTNDGWDSWPDPDGLHIMIAEVNTINDEPIIRQLLRADWPITIKLDKVCDDTGQPFTLDLPGLKEPTDEEE